jgi:hypothetical protein
MISQRIKILFDIPMTITLLMDATQMVIPALHGQLAAFTTGLGVIAQSLEQFGI